MQIYVTFNKFFREILSQNHSEVRKYFPLRKYIVPILMFLIDLSKYGHFLSVCGYQFMFSHEKVIFHVKC